MFIVGLVNVLPVSVSVLVLLTKLSFPEGDGRVNVTEPFLIDDPEESIIFPLVRVRFPDVIVVSFRLFIPVPVWLIIPDDVCTIFWVVENTGLFIVGLVNVLPVNVFVVLSPINTVVVVGSVKTAIPLVIVLFP